MQNTSGELQENGAKNGNEPAGKLQKLPNLNNLLIQATMVYTHEP